jgi:hypothetical protein
MQQLAVSILFHCKISLNVSGALCTHHQEYLKLHMQPLVQVPYTPRYLPTSDYLITELTCHIIWLVPGVAYAVLTFKGRMLNIYDAACTLRWPKVQYNWRHAGMKFFHGHGVYLSRKHIRTHCGSHGKAWHSLGAMMTFMVVRVSKLFMCTLDLQGTAEGVTGTTQ